MLNLPQQAFELMPISVLIGGLLGLGMLARGSELVVVRAAGVSVARIAVSAAVAGLLLAMVTALLGEVLAPPVQKFARQQKAFSKFSDVSFAGSGSAWVKDGNTIISVHEQIGRQPVRRCVRVPLRWAAGACEHRSCEPRNPRRDRGSLAAGWLYRDAHRGRPRRRDAASGASSCETKVNPGFLGLAASEPRQLPAVDCCT